jgi:hypothetical protein
MKINERIRFSHPVLSADTKDFTESIFKVSFEVDEDVVANQLKLKCKTMLDQDEIKELVKEGSAKIGVDIRCADTFYSKIQPIAEYDNTIIQFKPGELSGRVSLRPLIFSCSKLINFSSKSFHKEYKSTKFNLENGSILAWDDESVIQVGRKKLAPMDTIFNIAINDNLKNGEMGVTLEGSKIDIFFNNKTHKHVHTMRGSSGNQAVIINGVYLPAILQVLEYLREGSEFDNCDWYQVFKAKCDFYNINLESQDILANAQLLLKMPYLKIEENFHE